MAIAKNIMALLAGHADSVVCDGPTLEALCLAHWEAERAAHELEEGPPPQPRMTKQDAERLFNERWTLAYARGMGIAPGDVSTELGGWPDAMPWADDVYTPRVIERIASNQGARDAELTRHWYAYCRSQDAEGASCG